MQSPLLWIGMVVFCVGIAVALTHQQFKGPEAGNWLDYAALGVMIAGTGVFIAGAMLSASG